MQPWGKSPRGELEISSGDIPTTATSKRREVKKKNLERNILIELGVYMHKTHLLSLIFRHLDCSLPATSLTIRLHSGAQSKPSFPVDDS